MGENERDEGLSEEEKERKHREDIAEFERTVDRSQPGIRNLENPDIQPTLEQGILKKPGHRTEGQEAARKKRQEAGVQFSDTVETVKIKKGQANKDYQYTPGEIKAQTVTKMSESDFKEASKNRQEERDKRRKIVNETKIIIKNELKTHIENYMKENNISEKEKDKIEKFFVDRIAAYLPKTYADIVKFLDGRNMAEWVEGKIQNAINFYENKSLIDPKIPESIKQLQSETEIYADRLRIHIIRQFESEKIEIDKYAIGDGENKTLNRDALLRDIDSFPENIQNSIKKYSLATEARNILSMHGDGDIVEKSRDIWHEFNEFFSDPVVKDTLKQRAAPMDVFYLNIAGKVLKTIGSLLNVESLESKGKNMLTTAAAAASEAKASINFENQYAQTESIMTPRRP